MRREGPAALDLRPLFEALPIAALGLARLGVRIAQAETRMARNTAEAIVWESEPRVGRCPHEVWRVCCVPRCYGCRCHD